jgi:hypothetical protein
MRMEESDPLRKVRCPKPGGTGDKERGRRKFWRCDELEEDVAMVGYRNCRINTQSREEWQKLIEVKSHPRIQRHWRKKKKKLPQEIIMSSYELRSQHLPGQTDRCQKNLSQVFGVTTDLNRSTPGRRSQVFFPIEPTSSVSVDIRMTS